MLVRMLFVLIMFTASVYAQGCKSIIVKNASDEQAKRWNCSQATNACIAKADNISEGIHKGDHIVCDSRVGNPPHPITGYHVVLFTFACPKCPVGWLYVEGEGCGPHDLNCMD